MAAIIINTIEYLVLIVSEFAKRTAISEVEAYKYLDYYDVLSLCEKHYGIMHTLPMNENLDTIVDYCKRKGGSL